MSQAEQQQNPMIAELQGIIVFQAAQLAQLNKQVLAYQDVLGQTRQVLAHSEQLGAERIAQLEAAQANLEAVRKYLAKDTPLEELLAQAKKPMAFEAASPAPAPQTPAEVDA